MVLSETEAEAQLAALRRQREALDRTITDLTLYLELGRRLTAVSVDAPPAATASPPPEPLSSPGPVEPMSAENRTAGRSMPVADYGRPVEERASVAAHPSPGPASPPDDARSFATAPRVPEMHEAGTAGAADHSPTDAALSDNVLARRHGRALIEAALAALDEAGRPLHAGEILAVLTSRGFSLPGHDPVAALNTRLWKRSGAGGPLKRMGDAVYALVQPEEDDASHEDEG